jgi:hypothetical protein
MKVHVKEVRGWCEAPKYEIRYQGGTCIATVPSRAIADHIANIWNKDVEQEKDLFADSDEL